MKRASFSFVLLVPIQIFAAACGSGDEPTTRRELQRVRSGNVEVVLLSPNETLRQGKDTVFVEFRSTADGGLVDAGDVQATATMPMAGMAPMSGAIDVRPTDTIGRYSVATVLSMAGDWRIGIEWNGPAGRGSASLSASAQ